MKKSNRFQIFEKDIAKDPGVMKILNELTIETALLTAYEGLFSAIYKMTKAYQDARGRCRVCDDPMDVARLCVHCVATEMEVEEAAKRTVVAQLLMKHARAMMEKNK